MKKLVIPIAGLITLPILASENWLPLSISMAQGTIDVPTGVTNYVRTLNLRDVPVVKTGGGTLAVFSVTGNQKIQIEGGDVVFLPPLEATSGAVMVGGLASHLDASNESTLVYASGSTTEITGWVPAEHLNGAAGVTSSAGTSADGNPTVVKDDQDRTWIDFGNSGWMYLKEHGEDTSAPVGNNRYREVFAVVKKHPGVDHNPAVFGTYSQWNRYCPAGTTSIMRSSPYGTSDGNYKAYLLYRNADWSVNGQWVDPGVDTLHDDVQVIHVVLGSASYFNAIGRDYTASKGGFMIGEMLCYGQELTPEQRIANERYLMKKWGGKEHPLYTEPTAKKLPLIEYGATANSEMAVTGSLAVDHLLVAGSNFSKTGSGDLTVGVLPATVTELTVDEGNLTVNAYSRKPTAEVRAAMERMSSFVRIDASDPNTVMLDGTEKIAQILDADGRLDMSVVPFDVNYSPTLKANGQNGLPVIDMGPRGSSRLDSALLHIPAQKMAKSFYMVYRRYDGAYAPVAGPNNFNQEWKSGESTSIFHADAGGNFTKYASLTIDGKTVLNEDGGYPEGMHVFGMRNKQYDWASWGFYTFGGNFFYGGGGSCICEMIAGSADARAKEQEGKLIEEYLYEKWIKPVHTSLKSLSVGASSSIALAGDLTLTDQATVNVGIESNGKVGTVSTTGSLTLEGIGTVEVRLPEGVKLDRGAYPILSAESLADGTAAKLATWTLRAPQISNRKLKLVAQDEAICLDVQSLGLIMIIR